MRSHLHGQPQLVPFRLRGAMKIGPPWNVKATAFNQAVADGHILQARALLAQGEGPDETSWELAKLVDTPGALLFLHEINPSLSFLPGSLFRQTVESQVAKDKAEALGYTLEDGEGSRKRRRF